MIKSQKLLLTLLLSGILLSVAPVSHAFAQEELTENQMRMVKAMEQKRISAINQVIGSVVAIYDDGRQGGGSGVIIDPSGIALTNHHVIIGSGVKGWGGLADGKMYRWDLIGTDPGGDVSIIQMHGRNDFPFTPLGDSDKVKVGDWALAMGNPFVLTEDQKPTVTLGIVSGVKRYQYGAGQNQLVYGNCIQVDSSINPGNSGGPLFNMFGEVIGINGRGSFQDRGRVNVGLGYAISANQIKNFIPDLLATKLVEHGTLDANFSDRDGKVVCSTINELSPIYELGLRLGDELVSFEDIAISNANQFTNLICTLPEDWPAKLEIVDAKGDRRLLYSRLIGLPYAKPRAGKPAKGGDSPEEKKAREKQRAMIDLLAAEPGTVRKRDINQLYALHILNFWGQPKEALPENGVHLLDEVSNDQGTVIGKQECWIHPDGRFKIERTIKDQTARMEFDGKEFSRTIGSETKPLTLTEAKLTPPILECLGIAASVHKEPFAVFGKTLLDGSDKAISKNAFRFKTTDEEDDWFFFWISMYDEAGNRSARLVKAGADLDCDGKEGAVAFMNWKSQHGWAIPMTRNYVANLSETVNLTSQTTSVTPLEQSELNKVFQP